MATFDTVDDVLELQTADRGETVAIAISGTYVMVIELQKELGSVGSGAWQTIKLWNTTDATVAYDHITTEVDENLRLFLRTDTSGSATVTLTETSDLMKKLITDGRGNKLMEFRQSGVGFYGGQRHVSGGIVTLAASTLSLTAALHAGRIVVTAQAATLTVTLPDATGSGDVYTLFTSILATGDHIYKVANSGDSFGGGVTIATDIAGVVEPAVAGDDTLTMNGTTTGGLLGSWVRFTDVTAALWMIEGNLTSSGAESTCFSAGV